MPQGVEVATAYVSIVPETGGLARSLTANMGGIGKQAGASFSGGFGSTILKGAAVAGIGAGLVAAFKGAQKGMDFNAVLEQNKIGFESMLGSADKAKSLLGDLQKFAAKTPFEFPELADSAKKMLAMGFTTEQLLPTLTAVGDAASGLGLGSEGVDRITRALGQMKAKGKVSAEEMMQLTEAGIPAWDILAKSMGLSTAEVMKLSEKGLIPADKAVGDLVTGMEQRFPRMMDKQSKSFSGLMSTLKDNVNQTLGQVMAPAFEKIKDFLPPIIEGIGEFSKGFGEGGLAGGLKAILPPEVMAGLQSFLGFFKSIGSTVAGQLPALQTAFQNLAAVTGPTLQAWWTDIIKPIVDSVVSGFKSIATEVVPTVTAVINFIATNWPQIRAIIEPIMQGVLGVVGGVMKAIIGIIRLVMAVLRGDWSTAWQALKDIVSGVWQAIKSAIALSLVNVRNTLTNAWTNIKAAATTAWGNIKKAITDKMASLPGDMKNAGKAMLEGLWKGLTDGSWFKKAVSAASTIAAKILNAIKKALGIGGSEATSSGGGATTSIPASHGAREAGAQALGANVAKLVEKYVPGIKELLDLGLTIQQALGAGGPANFVKGLKAMMAAVGKPYVWGATGPDAFDCSGLVSWVLGKVFPGRYGRFTSGAIGGLFAPGRGKYMTIGWNPGHTGIADLLGHKAEARGKAYGVLGDGAARGLNEWQRLYHIPGFSTGGVVSGPTSGYPVTLHGTEGIFTREQMAHLAPAKGGDTYNLHGMTHNDRLWIEQTIRRIASGEIASLGSPIAAW